MTVTGTVDDLRPYLEEAAVYCAPLRFAAGIQNKLLEALAMELPVVTTPIAAAGLEPGARAARRRRRATTRALARRVVDLLADPEQRAVAPPAGPSSCSTSRGRPRWHVSTPCSARRRGRAAAAPSPPGRPSTGAGA